MKWLKRIALAVVALLSAVAAFIAKAQSERAKRAEADAKTQREAFAQVSARAERLQKAMNETSKTEEKAHDEKKELASTPDSSLVERANNLFRM